MMLDARLGLTLSEHNGGCRRDLQTCPRRPLLVAPTPGTCKVPENDFPCMRGAPFGVSAWTWVGLWCATSGARPRPLHLELRTPGCRTHDARMFYFYFQSRHNPATDPVVLWMTGGSGLGWSRAQASHVRCPMRWHAELQVTCFSNVSSLTGGPGCSSEIAIFFENGGWHTGTTLSGPSVTSLHPSEASPSSALTQPQAAPSRRHPPHAFPQAPTPSMRTGAR